MYLLSFCIPVYNNSEVVYRMVADLLSCKNNNFQVVIVDNASTDDTIVRLSTITDSRLKICRNKSNLGAQQNWCKALEHGDGTYLYLCMGRDRFNSKRIEYLLKLIQKVDDEKIPLAIDRIERQSAVQCKTSIGITMRMDKSGVTTLGKYASIDRFINVGEHQTGLIVRKDAFDRIKNPGRYFSTSYAYPDCYLKRDLLAIETRSAIINSGVYILGKTYVSMRKYKSNFEKRTDERKLYFHPLRKTQDFIRCIDMVEFSGKFHLHPREYDKFFCSKWKELLFHITTNWKIMNESKVQTAHYQTKMRKINRKEQVQNMFAAQKTVIAYYNGERKMSLKRRLLMDGLLFIWIGKVIFKCERI